MNARSEWRRKAMATPITKPSKEIFGEKEYRRIERLLQTQTNNTK